MLSLMICESMSEVSAKIKIRFFSFMFFFFFFDFFGSSFGLRLRQLTALFRCSILSLCLSITNTFLWLLADGAITERFNP